MANSILLVGNVLVDVFSLPSDKEKRLRLGGIIHAARALWGLGVEYHVAYIAPTYLQSELEKYLDVHGVGEKSCIGEVTGASNTILIGDPTEAGDQGYEVLLREVKKVTLLSDNLTDLLERCSFSDILFFPEASDPTELIEILNNDKSSVLHIDANNLPELINSKGNSGQIDVGTLFLSTSSCFFYPEYIGIPKLLENVFSFCDELILKENRGGTRAFAEKGQKLITIPSFPRKIVHSVGVGDAFDATYLSTK